MRFCSPSLSTYPFTPPSLLCFIFSSCCRRGQADSRRGEEMNLANLVHHHRHSTKNPTGSQPHQRIVACRSRAAQLYDGEMASVLTTSPYTSQPSVYAQSPQNPPSPPAEDITSKCTLPSIRSLIGMTDTSAPQQEPQRKLLPHGKAPPELTCPQQEQKNSSSKNGKPPPQRLKRQNMHHLT